VAPRRAPVGRVIAADVKRAVIGRWRVVVDTTLCVYPRGEVLDVSLRRDRRRHVHRVIVQGRTWTGGRARSEFTRGQFAKLSAFLAQEAA